MKNTPAYYGMKLAKVLKYRPQRAETHQKKVSRDQV
jgi:hypothetical protein